MSFIAEGGMRPIAPKAIDRRFVVVHTIRGNARPTAMKRLSIPMRLTILYGGLLFLALALSGAAVVTLLHYRLYQRLDESLDRRLRGVETFLRRETTAETAHVIPTELAEYASTQPEGNLIEVRLRSGRLLLRAQPVTPPSLTRTRQFSLYGQVFQTRASASLQPIEDSVQEMVYVFIGLAPVLMLFIAVAGYWISRRTLKPVDEITTAARSIGAANLGERLAVPASGDELSRLAEAWNEMLGRLDESFARMQQFTADAAHEFRTPLTGLRMTAELALRRQRASDEYREALLQILKISERMVRLNERLLALARGQDPPPGNAFGRVDMVDLVEGVLDEMEALFATKKLDVRLMADQPVITEADADGIRRLVTVLLENAQEYTASGGKINVSVRETSAGAELEVADTGCGIQEQALPRIFDRFYRVDPSRDRRTGGDGLGLAIARQIALAHHGTLEAASTPGAGATFLMRLPAQGRTPER
jgi:heavy metal sensor kinase